ncbi:MAG: hypothetical protein AUG12_04170 [Acidobacteria bacterium 13_1_20CM_2_57_8]|nr:MAG: hypothetical protein AUG12_04170 [Acidobacteria bacterium 13_1_20CM_2_57_8]
MKLSAQEEYGLRCLLRVASAERSESVTIPAIAEAEGLSIPYVGKLLSRPPEKIGVAEVLAFLGGRLFEPGFCDEFVGLERICTHSIDCSVRSLWRSVQHAVDVVLAGITLKDLLQKESEVNKLVALQATGKFKR